MTTVLLTPDPIYERLKAYAIELKKEEALKMLTNTDKVVNHYMNESSKLKIKNPPPKRDDILDAVRYSVEAFEKFEKTGANMAKILKDLAEQSPFQIPHSNVPAKNTRSCVSDVIDPIHGAGIVWLLHNDKPGTTMEYTYEDGYREQLYISPTGRKTKRIYGIPKEIDHVCEALSYE